MTPNLLFEAQTKNQDGVVKIPLGLGTCCPKFSWRPFPKLKGPHLSKMARGPGSPSHRRQTPNLRSFSPNLARASATFGPFGEATPEVLMGTLSHGRVGALGPWSPTKTRVGWPPLGKTRFAPLHSPVVHMNQTAPRGLRSIGFESNEGHMRIPDECGILKIKRSEGLAPQVLVHVSTYRSGNPCWNSGFSSHPGNLHHLPESFSSKWLSSSNPRLRNMRIDERTRWITSCSPFKVPPSELGRKNIPAVVASSFFVGAGGAGKKSDSDSLVRVKREPKRKPLELAPKFEKHPGA